MSQCAVADGEQPFSFLSLSRSVCPLRHVLTACPAVYGEKTWLQLEVWDHDDDGKHDFIGKCGLFAKDLFAAVRPSFLSLYLLFYGPLSSGRVRRAQSRTHSDLRPFPSVLRGAPQGRAGQSAR